jgi:hypothetical protein
MRWRLLLLVGGLAPLAGCHLAETAVHNAVNEPAVYLDEKHVTHQCRAEGKRVAKELAVKRAMSEDYEDGFVDGYADALERGGEPLPPAVPPTKYRRGRFLNPDGHARIHDYFAGFQHGASSAAASGKRQFLTVPIMLPDQPAEQLPAVQQVPKEKCDPAAGPNCPPPPVVSSLPASPEAKPTATELVAPKRPLISTPLVPPPPPGPNAPLPALPEATTDPPPAPPTSGRLVVPPTREPRLVVPPTPRK